MQSLREIKNITKKQAVREMGYDCFGEDARDFRTDGLSIEYNDGHETIWEVYIDPSFDDDGILCRYERHRGESPECCWTELELVPID